MTSTMSVALSGAPEQPASVGGMSLDEALLRMLAGLRPLPDEWVFIDDAPGRVVAHSLVAQLTLPPWDNTAMDGFAVCSRDVRDASAEAPVRLAIIGEVAAGHAPAMEVLAGTAVRILTGAPMPAGADAVVPVEQTDAEPGVADLPGEVSILAGVAAGAHIRRAGSDLTEGEGLIAAGTVIRPGALALLAATGHAAVPVHRRPRVMIMSTGDELVAPGEPLGPAQIYDSNAPSLAAQARAAGAEVRTLAALPDQMEAVHEALVESLGWADVAVVSGGVSVGAHDVVKEAFGRIGRLELWRVAVQPGKPLAFGRARRPGDDGEMLFFGLPGNPVSSFVTFELFVRPVLRQLAGHLDPTERRAVRARLAEAVTKAPGRRAFLRVSLAREPDGERTGGAAWVARPSGGQGSHVLSALAAADGLAIVSEDVEGLPAGAEVEVWILDGGEV